MIGLNQANASPWMSNRIWILSFWHRESVSSFFVDFTCAFYGEKGMVENWIVGMVGIALIVYLFVVLVRPEDF
jgi:K+-transporting ATPase KdpF subunit